eukprot:4557199-Karenia_brevis.AAC.1
MEKAPTLAAESNGSDGLPRAKPSMSTQAYMEVLWRRKEVKEQMAVCEKGPLVEEQVGSPQASVVSSAASKLRGSVEMRAPTLRGGDG